MHRRSRRHPGLVAFAVLWLTAALARAQTTTGAIDGVVRDPDKNPVPGVLVVSNSPSLIQKDLTVSTGQDGYYRLPALPPGAYAVSFRLPGFQTIERTGLIVTTGQTTSVDVELRLATIEETVTVVGASPTIDPRSAKLAFTYTRSLLENVPAVRNFHTMLYTMPGVEPNASAVGKVSAGTANYDNVLGGGLFANWYKFDGANATDPRVGSNQTQLFSYDIIDEVQVLKGGKPAEVGFAYGGFFQIVTKSGGNDFHGVGAVYYQDDAIQSDNVNDRLRQAGVRLTDRLVDSYDASASMGGRFVRDKLWWFGSARRQEQTLQVFGLPDPQEDRIKAFFWKNTYQPRPRHTLTGMVNHWDESVNPYPFGSAALLGERQATMITTPGGEAVNGRWKGTLTDTVMVDAGVAYSKESFERVDQPDSGIAIFDLVTGRRFRNRGIFYSTIPSWNWHSNGSLSWFVPDAAGRHDFKFGAEYTHGVVPSTFEQIGDHQLTLASGQPSQVWIYNTPVEQHLDLYLASVYAQDAWTIGNRLTLNLGARYDRAVGRLQDAPAGGGRFANTSLADRYPVLKRQTDPGIDLLTWNNLAPRLAASWSLDDRTAVKASFSRYYHYVQNFQLPGTGVAGVVTLRFQWNDLNGDREYQVGEEGRLLAQTGGRGVTADPNVRQPYSNEVVVGVSRELASDFSVNANFIYRRSDDLTDTIDLGIPFGTYRPVQIVDPGVDGRAGTGDDGTLTVYAQDPATLGRNVRLFTNPSRHGFDNDRTYRGFELILSKRLSRNWQFVGSLVTSRLEVTTPSSTTSGSGTFFSPNSLLNTRGRDPNNQTYQVKLQGTYQAPYGVVLSGFYRWSSGLTFTREVLATGLPQGPTVVFAEPRGSRETDNVSLLDFRVEKSVKLFERTRLGLMLDLFNLTNASIATVLGARTGVDLERPQGVNNPRIARLGVRFTW